MLYRSRSPLVRLTGARPLVARFHSGQVEADIFNFAHGFPQHHDAPTLSISLAPYPLLVIRPAILALTHF